MTENYISQNERHACNSSSLTLCKLYSNEDCISIISNNDNEFNGSKINSTNDPLPSPSGSEPLDLLDGSTMVQENVSIT